MDIYELVEIVRRKPGFYLHGGKSLKQLHSLLIGYEIGAKRGICGDFRPFNRWLAKRFSLPEASGWCNMVITCAGSDEAAFDLFFDLLDRFKEETRETKID